MADAHPHPDATPQAATAAAVPQATDTTPAHLAAAPPADPAATAGTDPTAVTMATYRQVAPAFADFSRGALTDPVMLRQVADFADALPRQADVADIGCGPGTHTLMLRAHGHTVTGFDLSEDMLRATGTPGLVRADLRRLPLPDNSLDGIWCVAVLLHLPRTDLPAALAEFARVLRPGGRMHLLVAEGEREGYEKASSYGVAADRWFTYYSEPELTTALHTAGFHLAATRRRPTNRDWLAVDCVRAEPGPLHIRPAEPGDAHDIAELWLASRAHALPTVRNAHPDDDVRDWIRHILIPVGNTWIAQHPEGTTAGMMTLEGDHLDQLYLHPDHIGHGIGGALLRLAQRLRPGGLDLWTFQVNTHARAFYRHHGFVEVETTDGSTNEEHEPDVRLAWAPTLLVPLAGDFTRQLIDLAVTDADPTEVMPPQPEGHLPGWTPEAKAALEAFTHADRGPRYAIVVDTHVIGTIRLTPTDQPGTAETGMWLGRTWRGQGHGTRALKALLAEAARHGHHTVIADTTPANTAAVNVLSHHRAQLDERGDGKTYARIPVQP